MSVVPTIVTFAGEPTPTAEYLRVYVTDRERMINRGYPPHQVMGTGLATQEYRA